MIKNHTIFALKQELSFKAYGYVPTSIFYAKFGDSLALAQLEKSGLIRLKLSSIGYLIHING